LIGEREIEPTLRAIFAVCAVCLALAIYSGHRIMAETHLHTGPSPIPGASRSLHRETFETLEQAQRIRASRLGITAVRPSSVFTTIMEVLSDR
jgi:hypothetical protein